MSEKRGLNGFYVKLSRRFLIRVHTYQYIAYRDDHYFLILTVTAELYSMLTILFVKVELKI